jgi:hypothetical protein
VEGVLKELIRYSRRTKMHMPESKGQEKDRGGTREKGWRAARQVFMIQAVCTYLCLQGGEGGGLFLKQETRGFSQKYCHI